ncbi:nucleolar pre-ribosomal-associated protein 1 [Biomphalaria glabrata]|uniref:Uncharacterized protein LOC106079403 isoform X1 n=1 Tax=Biomphalaria glabrata TaxID=6526 RepID=A0A9W2ZDI6_BIOGL|nr:uncharacterized protein LOC106079403 isoform X1 [Biomphalaria glabrata]KAI8752000.1 hypothetical protein BgiMline_014718 [Biomphalaria glabrata]
MSFAFKLFSAILLCAGIPSARTNEDLLFTDSLLTLDENVTISFSPPFIINGLTSDVDVTCSFTRDQVPAMTSIFSLVIAHSSTTDQPLYSYVASVNALEGHAHNISHDVEVISGLIDNQGESLLHIRFKYPDSNLTGLYLCEVQGFDQIGKPVTKYAKLKLMPTNINDLFHQINNLQSNLTEANANLSLLQNSFNAMQSCMSRKDEYINKLKNQSNFYSPVFFNGHSYYMTQNISRFFYAEAQNSCKLIDGYLAELDTQGEMDFFREYLIKMNISYYFWSGATKQNGSWVNEHSPAARPLFDWAPGEPANYQSGNCQCSYPRNDWKLMACLCNSNRNDLGYVCEVPDRC